MEKIRLFLADDHTILRDGLKYIITNSNTPGYEVVGEAGDGLEALDKIEKLQPDIAILDISMPSMSGVEITRNLRKYCQPIKIIILSQYKNEEYITQLFKYNIDAYLLKENAGDELLKAIEEISKGNKYLSPEITKMLLSNYSSNRKNNESKDLASHYSLLSPREREILKLIADGKTNLEIASTLFISVQTVKTHRANIMKKLNIHNLVDLIKYALKRNLIEE